MEAFNLFVLSNAAASRSANMYGSESQETRYGFFKLMQKIAKIEVSQKWQP